MADIHSRLAIPLDSFDEYHVYDESSVDLTEDHQKLIRVMKKKFDSGKNFFLYLHKLRTLLSDIFNESIKPSMRSRA